MQLHNHISISGSTGYNYTKQEITILKFNHIFHTVHYKLQGGREGGKEGRKGRKEGRKEERKKKKREQKSFYLHIKTISML